MTVKELIEELQKFRPEANVFCVSYDEDGIDHWNDPRPHLSDDGTKSKAVFL